MNSRVFKILVILLAGFGLVSGASRAHARPTSAEFTRIELGHAVSQWYPVDINGDGRWELAITCAGTPARIGVFSPKNASWLDGPHAVPVVGRTWGVGDYNSDGMLEYSYLNSNTVRLYNPASGTDSALWVSPFTPSDAVFLGSSAGGRPVVGLTCPGGSYSEGPTYIDYPSYVLKEWWFVHVYDLMDGTELDSFSGGSSPWRVVSTLPTLGTNSLIIHQQQMTTEQIFFVQVLYTDAILMLDPQWNQSSVIRFGSHWGSAGYPPDPAYLEHVGAIRTGSPSRSLLLVDMLTYRSIRVCNLECYDVDGDSILWSRSFPSPYYLNFAAYDLNSDGNPALYLPLESGAGWEVRALTTGAILDTLQGMPKADLQTGPLITAGHQDLFYVADSGLYIWGLPTAVFDDEAPTAGIPTSPHLTAFPNPFNSAVRLNWSYSPSATTLEIFNILGQRVRTYDLSTASGSRSSIEWDGRDITGHSVPSGLYFARLAGNRTSLVSKLVLLK